MHMGTLAACTLVLYVLSSDGLPTSRKDQGAECEETILNGTVGGYLTIDCLEDLWPGVAKAWRTETAVVANEIYGLPSSVRARVIVVEAAEGPRSNFGLLMVEGEAMTPLYAWPMTVSKERSFAEELGLLNSALAKTVGQGADLLRMSPEALAGVVSILASAVFPHQSRAVLLTERHLTERSLPWLRSEEVEALREYVDTPQYNVGEGGNAALEFKTWFWSDGTVREWRVQFDGNRITNLESTVIGERIGGR